MLTHETAKESFLLILTYALLFLNNKTQILIFIFVLVTFMEHARFKLLK